MQAKRQLRKPTRRGTVKDRSPAPRGLLMTQPEQNPPVERLYMRPVVGRRGRPELPEGSRHGAKRSKARQIAPGGDYLVELTTAHVRARWPYWAH